MQVILLQQLTLHTTDILQVTEAHMHMEQEDMHTVIILEILHIEAIQLLQLHRITELLHIKLK